MGEGGDLLLSYVLKSIAQQHVVTSAEVALAWCLRQPVTAIPKASSVQHVEENAAAADLQLTQNDLANIDAAYLLPQRKVPLATL